MKTNTEGKTNSNTLNRIVARALIVAGFLFGATIGFAQAMQETADSFSSIYLTATPVQAQPISMDFEDVSAISSLSDAQMATFVNALNATPLISCDALPRNGLIGNFFSLQHPDWPPLPMNSSQSPVWQMNGFYLMSDANYDYDADSAISLAAGPQMRMGAMGADDISPPGAGEGGDDATNTPADSPQPMMDYGPNLWIAQAHITNSLL